MYILYCIYIYIYIYILYIYIYYKFSFLPPSVDMQTRNYDTECSNHHPSLPINTKVKEIEPVAR